MNQSLMLSELIDKAGLVPRDFNSDHLASRVVQQYELHLRPSQSIEEVLKNIQSEMLIDRQILIDIYTSIVSGKHIILFGPPGSGKTTLAKHISALFNCSWEMKTATADWSTFDTVGGIKIRTLEGKESLTPVNGIIVEAIIHCCGQVSQWLYSQKKDDTFQAHWLIIDELNRAKMDAAFGQFFTALDQAHPIVSLDFHEDLRKRTLFVPRRFRIIGTMNTYDKNFLFRISYGLLRRFAFIPVLPPDAGEIERTAREKEIVIEQTSDALKQKMPGEQLTLKPQEIRDKYDKEILEVLYEFVNNIRGKEQGMLDRAIGTAQVIETFRNTVISIELGLEQYQNPSEYISALDRAIRSYIVPQLDGVPPSKLKEFIQNIESNQRLKNLYRTVSAIEELTRFGVRFSF